MAFPLCVSVEDALLPPFLGGHQSCRVKALLLCLHSTSVTFLKDLAQKTVEWALRLPHENWWDTIQLLTLLKHVLEDNVSLLYLTRSAVRPSPGNVYGMYSILST